MTQPNRSKSDLRSHFKSIRRTKAPERAAEQSRAIVRRVQSLPELLNARIIHSYFPSPALGEVDIRPLLNDLHQRGTSIILPVVDQFGETTATPRLRHVRWSPNTPMATNKMGIEEPDGEAADPATADLVIVPALAADRRGFRIGFGMGYYDEFLAELASVSICPVFSESLIDEVPSEDHDVSVDIVVTEEEIVRIATADDLFR